MLQFYELFVIFREKGYKFLRESYIIRRVPRMRSLKEENVMKLLKRIAVLSFCVVAVSGCTKSSISTQAPVIETEMVDPDKMDTEEDYPGKAPLVEEDVEEEPMFDWEQASEEAYDLFNDTDFYPESVKMDFEASEEDLTIDLVWVLKNGTEEDVANEYAADLVQRFNDVLAVQVVDVELSSADSFGGIWEQFALTVKVGTEDGTWLIDKSYAAGEEIDLELPQYSSEGPSANMEKTEKVSPYKGPSEKISPAMGAVKDEEGQAAPGK